MISEKMIREKDYKTMIEMKSGIKYNVVGFKASDNLVRRFFALGIRKGTSITFIKFSYLSHNLMINVDGVVYAIKSNLASLILVKEA